MPKMTPEQEAAYALDYGSRRESLSPLGQQAYDRLAEQRRRGEPDPPASLADAEAAARVVMKDARQALADGRRVFLCRIPAMYDQPIALGTAGLPGPSSVIESLENLGWRLDQMSWVPHPGRRAEGYFLFRRVPQVTVTVGGASGGG
jgi:hypothetical protein